MPHVVPVESPGGGIVGRAEAPDGADCYVVTEIRGREVRMVAARRGRRWDDPPGTYLTLDGEPLPMRPWARQSPPDAG